MVDKKTETKNIEREYVVPLRHKFQLVPRYKKTTKAVKTLKEFLVKHMKIRDKDLNKIKLDKSVNEYLWARGIRNPPSKVKVRAIKDGEFVKVELVELPTKIKFKKLREEKLENSAKEIVKKKKSEKVEEKTEDTDKNNDGVEDKKEVEEKKEAVVEAGQEMQKVAAKTEKHTTKPKSPKQEKNLKVSYNRSSQGH